MDYYKIFGGFVVKKLLFAFILLPTLSHGSRLKDLLDSFRKKTDTKIEVVQQNFQGSGEKPVSAVAAPWRFRLLPLNTIRFTRWGKKDKNPEETINLSNQAETETWNSFIQEGCLTDLADDFHQKIGTWAQSKMGIPLEQQSKIFLLTDNDFQGKCITKTIGIKEVNTGGIFTRKPIFRIYFNANLALNDDCYTLLHEAAHATQIPYWSYLQSLITPTIKLRSTIAAATLIGYIMGRCPYPRNIAVGARAFLGHSFCKSFYQTLKAHSKDIQERLAERKTLKVIRCPECLKADSKTTKGYPYNTPKQLLKKAAQLEKSGKAQTCPFHQKIENYKNIPEAANNIQVPEEATKINSTTEISPDEKEINIPKVESNNDNTEVPGPEVSNNTQVASGELEP